MIRSILACAVLVCAIAFAGPTTAPTTAPATQPAAANKTCPIGDEPIDPKVTCEYKGQTIGFCCKECIPEFMKAPERYIKDLK